MHRIPHGYEKSAVGPSRWVWFEKKWCEELESWMVSLQLKIHPQLCRKNHIESYFSRWFTFFEEVEGTNHDLLGYRHIECSYFLYFDESMLLSNLTFFLGVFNRENTAVGQTSVSLWNFSRCLFQAIGWFEDFLQKRDPAAAPRESYVQDVQNFSSIFWQTKTDRIENGKFRQKVESNAPKNSNIEIESWMYQTCPFSRMRSEGSRFIWGSGGEAVFAESCVDVRNRPQPFATVRNRLRERRKALHSGECTWSDPESVSSWLVSPQLYWRLQRRCLRVWSVAPQLYWCSQKRCQSDWSVSPQLYWHLQRRCLREWSVSPQLYWCLERSCQSDWSVSPGVIPKACQVDSWSPQLYWRLQRRCLCEWSVSPQLYWCLERSYQSDWFVSPQLYWHLQRRCLCEWSVSPQLYWCQERSCQSDWSVSPQLYWRLQRRCQCDWSVSPQLFWSVQRSCQCDWSVSPQLYWSVQRRCLCERSVSPQL